MLYHVYISVVYIMFVIIMQSKFGRNNENFLKNELKLLFAYFNFNFFQKICFCSNFR